jgi:DNA polymerase V
LVLVKAALHGVRKTWREGFRYSKAGVVTTDLLHLHASQRAMLGLGQIDREQGAALMAAIDACNLRFGRGAIVPAAAGFALQREWSTKFEHRSPRYTTRLDEIPVVAA